MPSFILFACSVLFTLCHVIYKKGWHLHKVVRIFLSYFLFFNVGVMGLLAAYAHVFMGPETAALIGWEPGSPFQFEMGMANLSYGVIGMMAFWIRDRFWDACIIGWSVLLLGCFTGHVLNYYATQNAAPYNMGPPIWFNDLFLPLLALSLLFYLRSSRRAFID